MTAKRIFILNGHPAHASLSKSITQTYAKAASDAGHDIRIMHLHDMAFDADFGFAGYAEHKPLETDLQRFQENIEWSEHIIMATPMWWGGLPAKLKGLFDRTLLPGWAFDTRVIKMGMPKPMLKGRTASVFVTSDSPDWFFALAHKRALFRQIKGQIFGFVGIKTTKITHFSVATKADAAKVAPWLKTAAKLGTQGL